jgi:hypothetical protein
MGTDKMGMVGENEIYENRQDRQLHLHEAAREAVHIAVIMLMNEEK